MNRPCIYDDCRGWALPGEAACASCDVESRGGPAAFYVRGPVALWVGDVRDVSPWWRWKGCAIWDPPYSEHTHAKSRAGARKTPLHGSRAGHTMDAPGNISRSVDLGFGSLTHDLRRFLIREVARLCDRWSIVFSDFESAHLWRLGQVAAGLEYVRTGAWEKENGTPQFTGDRPAVGFEALTICHPIGEKRWNGGGRHAIWKVPIVLERAGHRSDSVEPRLHTTQKPQELLLALVNDFTDPEQDGKPPSIIYDFTAGVCTGGIAAIRGAGGPRFWIGCELDPVIDLLDCSICGKEKSATIHRGQGHEFNARRDRAWAKRAAARLDAELDGSTYHAARQGQRPLFGAT